MNDQEPKPEQEESRPEQSKQEEPKREEELDLDPQMVRLAIARFKREQNLPAGILAGFVAALAGAGVWAVITVATGYQIGFMAIGVGFLVGVAVRAAGNGIDRSFAVAGALLALFGCLLGNLLTVSYIVASTQQIGFFDILTQLTPRIGFELMKISFNPMDVLFYAIAIYEGYKLSNRRISREELLAAVRGGGGNP